MNLQQAQNFRGTEKEEKWSRFCLHDPALSTLDDAPKTISWTTLTHAKEHLLAKIDRDPTQDVRLDQSLRVSNPDAAFEPFSAKSDPRRKYAADTSFG